jgi:predicted TIM-barrel fold metal-dependent hydrolase
MSRPDDDRPVFPIELGPISNGEHMPYPTTEITREAQRRLRRITDDAAPRLNMSRRDFLRSSCGTAAALFVLASCSNDASRSRSESPGGTFTVPETSTTDPEEAREVLGGDEFVFDVQTHLLEYAPDDDFDFGAGFPYTSCGEADAKACFGTDHWFRELFVRSDTTMAVISAVPIIGEPNPLSIDVMERARAATKDICGDDRRVFLHGQVNPNVGDLQQQLDHMRALAAAHPIAAWKVYTHAPGDRGWWLDDHDPGAVICGEAFVDTAREVGSPIVCVHKGLAGGAEHASPVDIGPVAKAHPDVAFVVYHSGYDGPAEGPYEPDNPGAGVDRLLASLDAAGVEPHANVYAELGTTWFNVMRDPTQAAHVLGKLLARVGDDRVLWGTDSIWYGTPQQQIEAMRTFAISNELQDRYGYPALTDEVKRKVFGASAAKLYGIDAPATAQCNVSEEALAELRAALPPPRAWGPRTAAQATAHMREHFMA